MDVDPDLLPVVDLLELTIDGRTENPRALAKQLVDALVRTPGAAYALAIAHADWRAQQ